MKNFHAAFTMVILMLLFSFSKTNAQESDSTETKKVLELSFGQSLLFISDSKVIDLHTEHAVVVPTSALLFFAELRPQKKVRIPVFLNLPTESKQFIVNGQLTNEPARPVFGFGLQFKVFHPVFCSKYLASESLSIIR